MSALRAFRKPEVSITLSEDIESSTQQSYTTRNLKLYTGDEREPLPLALHHTPLSVSLGLFRVEGSTAVSRPQGDVDTSKKFPHGLIFVADPSHQEELAMDGLITFSVNSHRYMQL
jgi:exosome complex RNA-binding protein Rrp42 (RNase PH superfamily)